MDIWIRNDGGMIWTGKYARPLRLISISTKARPIESLRKDSSSSYLSNGGLKIAQPQSSDGSDLQIGLGPAQSRVALTPSILILNEAQDAAKLKIET